MRLLFVMCLVMAVYGGVADHRSLSDNTEGEHKAHDRLFEALNKELIKLSKKLATEHDETRLEIRELRKQVKSLTEFVQKTIHGNLSKKLTDFLDTAHGMVKTAHKHLKTLGKHHIHHKLGWMKPKPKKTHDQETANLMKGFKERVLAGLKKVNGEKTWNGIRKHMDERKKKAKKAWGRFFGG